MLSESVVQKVLGMGLSKGADFSEIFVEETYSSELSLIDSGPAAAVVGRLYGAGIRLFYGHETIYVTTNDLSETGLLRAAQTAAQARTGAQKQSAHSLKKQSFDSIHKYGKRPWETDRDRRFALLRSLDQLARARNSMVSQVAAFATEKNQKIMVANSNGLFVEDERNYTRLRFSATVEDKGAQEESHGRSGELATSEVLDSLDLKKMAHDAVDRAVLLVHADYAPAGEMPVVIDQGFGGVIFHEACGHGLETTSIAKGASVFCDRLGTRVANECVTAIDDGTLASHFGSLTIDDEGRPTQKTVLIENGILKSYLVDQMGSRKTGYAPTGSGRRQSYKFAPASRMRNTYIAAGFDSLDDMIRDLDYGIYAKRMGGGQVNPATGDYNFGVSEAYIVRNGKIEKPVKGVLLIGKGIETLGRIVKVGRDLKLEPGMCGSISGSIPTTVGQPAILVSKLLVGGRAG